MAKTKAFISDWLDLNEHLGYDEYNIPNIKHVKDVAKYQIKYWEYHGYKSEKSYYTKRKPSRTSDEVISERKKIVKNNNWAYKEEYYSSCCFANHDVKFSYDDKNNEGICTKCKEHTTFDKHIEYGANDGK